MGQYLLYDKKFVKQKHMRTPHDFMTETNVTHVFRKSNFRKGGFGTKTYVEHTVFARLIKKTCFLEIEFSKRRFRDKNAHPTQSARQTDSKHMFFGNRVFEKAVSGGNPLKSGLHSFGALGPARIILGVFCLSVTFPEIPKITNSFQRNSR